MPHTLLTQSSSSSVTNLAASNETIALTAEKRSKYAKTSRKKRNKRRRK